MKVSTQMMPEEDLSFNLDELSETLERVRPRRPRRADESEWQLRRHKDRRPIVNVELPDD
jgi:hypothetical protein